MAAWVPRFLHTLEQIAKKWHAQAELRQDTVSWDPLVDIFVLIVSTNEVCPALDAVKSRPDWTTHTAHAIKYYNLAIDEDDDPCNIGIPESEEHCDVHEPAAEALEVT